MIPAMSVVRREDATLVVIDPQERLAAAMGRRQEVAEAAVKLIRVAELTGLPIVVTRQYPKGLGDLEPQVLAALAAARDSGASVTTCDKTAFDCFAEPSFVEAIAENKRHQLVLCGMEAHICIMQTALDAMHQGYDVHVVADAVCSRRDSDYRVALERLRCGGAVVTTHESVLYELVGVAGTDEFKALLGIVKG
jgi:nicotinamidase-related amidase